jgi:hypothetical protein
MITAPEVGPTDGPFLEGDTFIPFIGATNNELKCLVLGAMGAEPISAKDLHHRLMVEADGASFHDMDPRRVGVSLDRVPEKLATSEVVPGIGKLYTKTEAGEVATGLAGHMLTLSLEANRPLRTIVGDWKPGNGERVDSIEARLVILTGLNAIARNRWQYMSVLRSEVERFGMPSKLIHPQLERLVSAGLTEKRTGAKRSGGLENQYRLGQKSTDGMVKPFEVVGKFLGIVRKFSALEPEFIDEGVEQAHTIAANKSLVPALIKRSFASDSNSSNGNGKSNDSPSRPFAIPPGALTMEDEAALRITS